MSAPKENVGSSSSPPAPGVDELEQLRAFHASVFDATPIPLLRVDRDVRAVRVNRAVASLAGVPPEELMDLLGGDILACIHAAEGEGCGKGAACKTCPIRTAVSHTFDTGEPIVNRRARMEVRRGEERLARDFLVTTTRVQSKDGVEVLVALDDVTEHELTQAELASQRRSLEGLVAERTMDLLAAQEQLRVELLERERVASIFRARAQLLEFAASHSLDQLLEETLNVVEELTASQIGFYHFVDAEQRTLRLQNWSTATKNRFCSAEGKGSHYPIDRAGVWVDCFHVKQPVVHNDYAFLPHRKGLPDGHAVVVRELVVPVLRAGEVVAILGVGNKASDYDQRDVELISTFADLAWEIVEHKQAEQRAARFSRLLQAIGEVRQLMLHEKDSDRLIRRACELLLRTQGYRAAWIALDDEQGRPPRWAGAGWGAELETVARTMNNGCWTACRDAAQEAEDGIVVLGPAVAADCCPQAPGQELTTAVATLLRHGDVPLGLLVVALPDSGPLDAEERTLLAEVARDLSLALWSVRADRERQLSEARYRSLVDDSVLGIGLLRGGEVVYANNALRELLGYGRFDELAGKSVLDLIAPSSRPMVAERLQALARGEHVSPEYELELLRRDGSICTTIAHSTYRFLDGERYTQSTFQDITQRRRAEEQLRKLALAVEASSDAIAIATPEGRHVYQNRAMTELFGDFGDDPLAVHVDAERARQMFGTVMAGDSWSGTLPMRGKSGDPLSISLRAYPIKNDDGEILGLVGVHTNVTDRERVQAQVSQAERLARMGLLAAGVAHEINNPLTYLLYNLESLSEELPALLASARAEGAAGAERSTWPPAALEDFRARFEDALCGAERIKEIAERLGAFSRVDKDRLAPVKMPEVLDGAIQMVHNEIKFRATLVREIGEVPTVVANEGKLSQVFLNLLLNACHAIDEGDVERNEIRVRTWQAQDAVCAEVRDSGRGIAPHDLPRLFEPFFTTKEIGSGTGLGLTISKSIVEEYGGSLEVQSELGAGASFVVRFPLPAVETPAEPVEAAEAPTTEPARGRVLVIDDEEPIRTAMKRILRKHAVVVAASGVLAKEILEADQAFDLILCDLMMPEMSGVELHEWLVAQHPSLAERVVFVTGGAFMPKTRAYLAKVDNASLDKPLDLAKLRKLVNERVERQRKPR